MRYIRVLAPVFLILLMCGNGLAMELLVNGGFETGDLTGWASTNVEVLPETYGITPPAPSGGTYMAVLAPNGLLDAEMSQAFSPAGFSELRISFDYNLRALDWTKENDFGTDSFSVSIGSLVLLSIPLNDLFDALPSVLGWQTFSQAIITTEPLPSGPFTMFFNVENYPPDGGDLGQLLAAYVDNVSIDATNPVPEPGTILLLGSGLLGLGGYSLRKRRTA